MHVALWSFPLTEAIVQKQGTGEGIAAETETPCTLLQDTTINVILKLLF